MRTVKYIIIFVFICTSIVSQTTKKLNSKDVWTFHHYDYEWTDEADNDNCFQDTLYSIQFFPKKNDWKVYFDESKTKVATLLHFDTVNKTINTKHYNRQGKLIRELEANYFGEKKYNPSFIKVENIVYLKSFLNDSLIYEIRGETTSLFIKYNNFKTKRHFESRAYYADGEHYRDEEIGRTFVGYYDNLRIKTFCNSYTKKETDKDGVTIAVRISDCKEFDRNGCLISEK